ncbi:hypothetical protein TGPRC2_221295 [Toxoplasma gondii TgCatPRC2]|uniref:Uncharacterized protein n=1 Tax=Toxoplasma gondii TgCatPRC2 TaxID=1130821 RepID=A0A151HI92_TOXGO|nr:hypothetical protein TGPRC2_221295 [Toxoplasma gondii TgCatPRC2]
METTACISALSGSLGDCKPDATQHWGVRQPFVMEAMAELQKHPYSSETTTVHIILSVSPPLPLRGCSGYFYSRYAKPRLVTCAEGEAKTIKRSQISNILLHVNGKLVDTARLKKDGRMNVDVMVGDQTVDLSGKIVELHINAVHTTKLVEFDLDLEHFFPLHNIWIDVDGRKLCQDTGHVHLNFSTEHPTESTAKH